MPRNKSEKNSTIERTPETRDEAKRRAQRAAQAQFDANRRAANEVARGLHTKLLFWTVCPHKPCQRAHACRGDVNACGARCYPQIPPEIKASLVAYAQAINEGATRAEALRASEAAIERCREVERMLAEHQRNECDPSVPLSASPVAEDAVGAGILSSPRLWRARRGPRVRGL
jgi:hypothetical protein